MYSPKRLSELGFILSILVFTVGTGNALASDPDFRTLDILQVSAEAWVRPPYEKSKVIISKEDRRLLQLSVSVIDGTLDVTANLPTAFFEDFPDPQLHTTRILDSISEGSGVGIAVRLNYGPPVAVAHEDGACRILANEAGTRERADASVQYATAEIYVDFLDDRTLSLSRRDACFNPDEWEEEFALKEGEHLTGTGWRVFQERIDRKRREDARALEGRGLDEIMIYSVTPKRVAWESIELLGRSPEGRTQVDFGAKRGGVGFPAEDRSNTHADLFGGVLKDLWFSFNEGERFHLPQPFLSQFERPMLDSLRLWISETPEAEHTIRLKIAFRFGLAWREGSAEGECSMKPYADGSQPPSQTSALDTNRAEIVFGNDGNVFSVSKWGPCGSPI